MKTKVNTCPHPVPRAKAGATLRTAARTLWTFVGCGVLAVALLVGCAKHDDTLLPNDKQSVSLTAGIGQVQTRTAAGADDTKTIWQVGDQIGFFADGGYENIPCTATATDGSGWSGLYWKSTNKLTNIKAYYPYKAGGYKENNYDTFTILADQSTETNYYQSDVLKGTAGETAFNSTVSLNFTHLMSKLCVELTTEDENAVALSDLKGATVQVTNMYTKLIDYGSYASPTGNSANTFTLYNRSTANKALFQAIAVSNSYLSSNNQIIITSADGQRVYKGNFPESVQLAANKQYAYTFKVTKNLKVIVTQVASGVGWEEGTITPSDLTEDTYTMYFPADRSEIKELKVNGDDVTTGNSYQMKTGATGFTVTYQHADGATIPGSTRFTPGFGRYKLARSYNESSKTYTDTYTDIVTDIPLTWDREAVGAGDYFYKDGTWLPYYQSVSNNPCIGIVFCAGEGVNDTEHSGLSTVRGYVVALTDAGSGTCIWGERRSVGTVAVTNANDKSYSGYYNTRTTIAFAATLSQPLNYPYEAFNRISDFVSSNPLPPGTSGWYLPSLGQLTDMWELYKHTAGNLLYDCIQKAGGTQFQEPTTDVGKGRGGYWTSTERSDHDAWFVLMGTNGEVANLGKNNNDNWGCRPSLVRLAFTF